MNPPTLIYTEIPISGAKTLPA